MLLVDRAACTEYAGLSHQSKDETNAERENSLHKAPARARGGCLSHRAVYQPALPVPCHTPSACSSLT